ncbi:MAG: response regulator [Pseudomonadota bacterium]|nr:response regulator [Pseudomonadota bacterium]
MKKRILIVEDNDLNLKLFRDLLTAHGYETIETKEGGEAVSLTKSEHPDLILMDIQLPEISGLDVMRRLKSDDDIRNIPIIAVTAFAMKDDEEKILSAGCEAYISKPISIVPFLNTVRKFLGEEEVV